jgi:hypothetical protein
MARSDPSPLTATQLAQLMPWDGPPPAMALPTFRQAPMTPPRNRVAPFHLDQMPTPQSPAGHLHR